MPAAKRSVGQSAATGTAIASVSKAVPTRPVRTSSGRVDRRQSRQARPEPRLERAADRADQVADVVGAREPARRVQIDDTVVQHHRQDRREREPADAHRDGERDQAGDGDRCRAQSGSSTISTQFGLVPTGWSPSSVKRTARAVDGVAAEAMRGLADGEQKTPVGVIAKPRGSASVGVVASGVSVPLVASTANDASVLERRSLA